MCGIKPSPTVTRLPCFIPLFPRFLEITQPDYTGRDSCVIGIVHTLSRIDCIFIDLPLAETRDFHCYSHVFENLGKRSIPSDIAAARVVIRKHTIRGHQGKRISSWMYKQPVFCSIPKRLHDGHQHPVVPWRTRELQIVREFSRKSPDSRGAKLLTVSIPSRPF